MIELFSPSHVSTPLVAHILQPLPPPHPTEMKIMCHITSQFSQMNVTQMLQLPPNYNSLENNLSLFSSGLVGNIMTSDPIVTPIPPFV
jgi:hypothetical protein